MSEQDTKRYRFLVWMALKKHDLVWFVESEGFDHIKNNDVEQWNCSLDEEMNEHDYSEKEDADMIHLLSFKKD